MVKRPYARPTILRVQLNHEQAVLSVCSTLATSIYTSTGRNCRNPMSTTSSCRRGGTTGADSSNSS